MKHAATRSITVTFLSAGFLLLACTACSAAQASVDAKLPEGVKAVWDLNSAYRETTPTRERICINGLYGY